MKIGIMGSGGLGGFFGGWLAASGVDVSFIARGEHLDAMRANGLTVTSQLGDRRVSNVQATDDPNQAGPVDIILFCVKNYDLEVAAEKCRPMLSANTAVISLLNGCDAAERIGAILGPKHAVSGLTFVPSNIASPGVIAHLGDKTDLVFGELDGTQSSRLAAFCDVCCKAGLNAQVSPDITTAVWSKFVGWSAVSAVTSASRMSFGGLQSTPELIQLYRDVITENFQVGLAKGAKLPDGLIDKLVGLATSYPPEAKPSMLVDLERRKPIELETACGTIAKLGENLGVKTPLNRALFATLLPFIDG
ncbi:MAG: ketopantoate reductase family protein [Rhizobiaceae bacterium]